MTSKPSDSPGPEAHDQRRRRCPRLGHEIAFGYCRRTDAQSPCTKLLDCWFEMFDVAEWARQNLSPGEMEKLTAAPKPKMLSLVELIQQAQKRTAEGQKEE
jgi:hypothetical protein